MSILINSARFQLYAVFWPVYQIQSDEMVRRCFRLRVGSWHFPKRGGESNRHPFYRSL